MNECMHEWKVEWVCKTLPRALFSISCYQKSSYVFPVLLEMDFKFGKTLLTKLYVLNKSSLFSYYSIKCLVFDQQGIKGITTTAKENSSQEREPGKAALWCVSIWGFTQVFGIQRMPPYYYLLVLAARVPEVTDGKALTYSLFWDQCLR